MILGTPGALTTDRAQHLAKRPSMPVDHLRPRRVRYNECMLHSHHSGASDSTLAGGRQGRQRQRSQGRGRRRARAVPLVTPMPSVGSEPLVPIAQTAVCSAEVASWFLALALVHAVHLSVLPKTCEVSLLEAARLLRPPRARSLPTTTRPALPSLPVPLQTPPPRPSWSPNLQVQLPRRSVQGAIHGSAHHSKGTPTRSICITTTISLASAQKAAHVQLC